MPVSSCLVLFNGINLLVNFLTRASSRAAPEDNIKSNLSVDSFHTLHISLSHTLAAENNVHFLEREAFRFGNYEPNEGRANECQDTEDEISSLELVRSEQ